MNLEELKKDLTSKIKESVIWSFEYFYEKLFKNDIQIYQRRSFGDLFKYYRRYGITEKMLITALIELDWSCYYCGTPKKIVFFKEDNSKIKNALPLNKSFDKYIVDKYTCEYLLKLIKS